MYKVKAVRTFTNTRKLAMERCNDGAALSLFAAAAAADYGTMQSGLRSVTMWSQLWCLECGVIGPELGKSTWAAIMKRRAAVQPS